MIVSCPSCTARFNISDTSLAAGPRKVKCGRCGHLWRVVGPSTMTATMSATMPGSPSPAPASAPAPARQQPARAQAPAMASRAAGMSAPAQRSVHAPARAERRGSGGLWVGWLLLVVVVGGVAGGGYLGRGWLVETWPPAERAFDWLGVPLPRIEIVERTERESEEAGTHRLLVGGVLANQGERELPVPTLVFTLYDARGEPVNQWREAPPVAVLSPGEQVPFTSTVGISSGEGAADPRWEVMLLRDDTAPPSGAGDSGADTGGSAAERDGLEDASGGADER